MGRKSKDECCACAGPHQLCLCPVDGVMEVLSRRWAIPIVASLGNLGRLRFHELEKKLPGIPPSTLTQRLRQLEAAGLLQREAFPEVPPRVEYRLSKRGESLEKALSPLVEWAAKEQ